MMMQTTLLGIGIALVMLSWSYMWRPTVLDSARDKLFDLRDNSVRAYFIERGLGLDHHVYKGLRELLNGHLRYTESLSFFGFISIAAWTAQNFDLDKARRQEIDAKFKTDDPALESLVKKVREQSALIMIEYMIESSIVALTMAIIGWVIMDAVTFAKSAKRFLFGDGIPSGQVLARLAVALLSVASIFGVMTRSNAQITMEECALSRQA